MNKQVGLYGKLPAKRDFVALNLPAGFLGPWEEWLQTSVAASRQALGERWLSLFLAQPIWRFWLGRGICGKAVSGAFMPSVDGVGRYFPLCICVGESPGVELPPPPIEPMPGWFAAAEQALLNALDPDFAGDPLDLVRAMPEIPAASPPEQDSAEDRLIRLLQNEAENSLRQETWWWTLGGGDIPPAVLRFTGLPDPYRFTGFMSAPPQGSEAAA